MMDWVDSGLVLGLRPFGEADAIVSLLTRDHGRHLGLVKGGRSRRRRGGLEPGTLVAARWRARLEDHLGTYACETETAIAAAVLDDGDRLAALVAVCAMADAALPEREPHPGFFALCRDLLLGLGGADWAGGYADFERALLDEMGYGLRLEACAAGGAADDLAYVSPKSGCAVSRAAGAPYAERLLRFPEVFRRREAAAAADVLAGLDVTGYFLRRHVFEGAGRRTPEARHLLMERLRRLAERMVVE